VNRGAESLADHLAYEVLDGDVGCRHQIADALLRDLIGAPARTSKCQRLFDGVDGDTRFCC
jgi:hypothetical protein